MLADLGKVWRITEVAQKPFPSGRATHGLLDGVLALQQDCGFAAADVAQVRCRVPPLTQRLVGRPAHPEMAPNQARLSAPYVIAAALLGGAVDLDDFRPAALADPARLALAARVVVEADANPDPNALGPVEVAVLLKGGSRHATLISEVYGSPARPMGREAHLAKFRRNWLAAARPLPAAAGERLIALIDGLETLPDVAPLIEQMVA